MPRSTQVSFAISLSPPSWLLYALLLIVHTSDFVQRTAFGLQGAL